MSLQPPSGNSDVAASIPSNGPDTAVPQPAVIIDHRFFPHIVDLVLSFLNYPGLIHCTAVCKSWRARAQARLFDHVAVFEYRNEEQSENKGLEDAESMKGEKSKEVCTTEQVLVRSRNLKWPDASIKLIAVNSNDIHSMDRVYRNAAVVDCYCESFEPDQAVGPPACWPTTFQRLLDCERVDPLPEAQNFSTDQLDWSDIAYFIDYVGDRYEFGPMTPGYPVTLAVTISCYSDPTQRRTSMLSAVWPDFQDLMSDADVAPDLTIILKNCMDQEPPSHLDVDAPVPRPSGISADDIDSVRQLGALCEFLLEIVTMEYDRSIKVVGLECIGSGENQTSYMQRVCDLVESASDYLPDPPEYNGMPSVGTFFMFYTHEQCREEVGEERYRLLTVQ